MSNKTQDTRLLIVFDDSDASVRAVRYVAKLVAQRRQFRICLVHVLPPLPPALMEHGGSEDPLEERRLDLAQRTGPMDRNRERAGPKIFRPRSDNTAESGSFRTSSPNTVLRTGRKPRNSRLTSRHG